MVIRSTVSGSSAAWTSYISPLQGDHPRIRAELRRQLLSPYIESIDSLCTPLQQAIDEAAGLVSDIQGH